MLKRKIDGYYVDGYWMPTKEIMAMWPDPKQRERLPLRYEPKEEPMVVASLLMILLFGVVAFTIFGALTWELHLMGWF